MKRYIAILISGVLLLSLSVMSWAQSGRTAATARTKSSENITLKGEITNVLIPLAKFKSKDKEYTVHLGPAWYWKQENLQLDQGEVEIVGYQEEEDGEWHLYPSKIVQGQKKIVLVTDAGYPKWANTRGRGQRGRGWHHGHCGQCCRR